MALFFLNENIVEDYNSKEVQAIIDECDSIPVNEEALEGEDSIYEVLIEAETVLGQINLQAVQEEASYILKSEDPKATYKMLLEADAAPAEEGDKKSFLGKWIATIIKWMKNLYANFKVWLKKIWNTVKEKLSFAHRYEKELMAMGKEVIQIPLVKTEVKDAGTKIAAFIDAVAAAKPKEEVETAAELLEPMKKYKQELDEKKYVKQTVEYTVAEAVADFKKSYKELEAFLNREKEVAKIINDTEAEGKKETTVGNEDGKGGLKNKVKAKIEQLKALIEAIKIGQSIETSIIAVFNSALKSAYNKKNEKKAE